MDGSLTSKNNHFGLFASLAHVWDGALEQGPAERMLVKEKEKLLYGGIKKSRR